MLRAPGNSKFRQMKGSSCLAWVVICRWRGRATTAGAAHFILEEVKTMANRNQPPPTRIKLNLLVYLSIQFPILTFLP